MLVFFIFKVYVRANLSLNPSVKMVLEQPCSFLECELTFIKKQVSDNRMQFWKCVEVGKSYWFACREKRRGGNFGFANMYELDRILIMHWLIINLSDTHLCSIKKYHFWMYLLTCWGADFMTRVMESRVPLIIPLVSYRETWNCTIHILYWMFDGSESWTTCPGLVEHLCRD